MYTYARLLEDMSYLSYCGLDVGTVGLSTLKNEIPYLHLGEYSGGQAIITGGIHARENITSLLVMRQAFRAAFSANPLEGGIYFVPMLNPDGALLIEKGVGFLKQYGNKDFDESIISADSNKNNENCIANGTNCTIEEQNCVTKIDSVTKADNRAKTDSLQKINGSDDFRLWKANINGVDLNNNFDARFGQGVGQKNSPSPQGYAGEYPFSECETRALKDFTLKVKPQITLSYHALGQEIYWEFFQNSDDLIRDKQIASKINEVLGYKIVDGDMGSTGGYKDWCVSLLKIPSITVEIIGPAFAHPLGDIDPDWEQNKDIPFVLSKIASGLF